ncbi:aminotransferase class IV [Chryseobacterium sp. A301]
MSRFIESIKITATGAHLLSYHQKRVEDTFQFFGKTCPINLEQIASFHGSVDSGVHKLRVVYDLEGRFESRITTYSSPVIPSFQLVECPKISYRFKKEDRAALEQTLQKIHPSQALITQNGLLTDSTFSNLVFLKEDSWYTPESYLLNGVQRQYLLERKRIQEAHIGVGDLQNYSHFALINALNPLEDCTCYPLDLIQNIPI